MLQPSAHPAQEDEAAVAQLQALAQGEDHIGVVLLRRELDDVGVAGPVAQGVEVAHRQVGVHPVGHQGVEPQVGGDDVVPQLGVGAQRGRQGHGPHNVADVKRGIHGIPRSGSL